MMNKKEKKKKQEEDIYKAIMSVFSDFLTAFAQL